MLKSGNTVSNTIPIAIKNSVYSWKWEGKS